MAYLPGHYDTLLILIIAGIILLIMWRTKVARGRYDAAVFLSHPLFHITISAIKGGTFLKQSYSQAQRRHTPTTGACQGCEYHS